jgi:hypothetical protein
LKSSQSAHDPNADEVDGSRSRHLGAKVWTLSSNHEPWEPPVMEITTIGLDLAKSIFQVHGISAAGEVNVRKALRRGRDVMARPVRPGTRTTHRMSKASLPELQNGT